MQPSTLVVRPVRPEEYVETGRIVLAAYDAAGRIEGPYRIRIEDTAARAEAGSEVWVAVDGGRVLGSVTFTDAGDPNLEDDTHGDCGFRMLGVDPAAQGLGVGRTLVQRCIDTATERGRRRLSIYSMIWMPAAHAMYERMGFTRRRDRDVLFPAGVGWAFQRNLVPDADAWFPSEGPPAEPPPWYLDVLG
ncbi:MAG: GNAT family N-acetyltransferase [Actinomycetota bacterium]